MAVEPHKLSPREEYRLHPKRLPRKMKKRRKLLLEMRLKGVSVDGKWVVFVNQSGMVAQFPVHSSRLLARLRREENRVRKGGGRKYVFNQK